MAALRFVASAPARNKQFTIGTLSGNMPGYSSTAHKLWLSRVILQTVWRWRRLLRPTVFLDLFEMEGILAADGDQIPDILKTNLFLTLAISLGLQIDILDLYAPNNKYVTSQSPPTTPLIEQQRHVEDNGTPFASTISAAHHGGEW